MEWDNVFLFGIIFNKYVSYWVFPEISETHIIIRNVGFQA